MASPSDAKSHALLETSDIGTLESMWVPLRLFNFDHTWVYQRQ
jgi:hypothetical protein